ncbi:hypothetical protein QMK30_37535, partial [Streptomyces sp. H27-C3]|nr:hypothetical protein [Streptomyces sp. H27-C3]
GQPSTSVNQISMKRRSLMHVQMLTSHGPRVEWITELVQLTDQAWHKVWIALAAGVAAAGGAR